MKTFFKSLFLKPIFWAFNPIQSWIRPAQHLWCGTVLIALFTAAFYEYQTIDFQALQEALPFKIEWK